MLGLGLRFRKLAMGLTDLVSNLSTSEDVPDISFHLTAWSNFCPARETIASPLFSNSFSLFGTSDLILAWASAASADVKHQINFTKRAWRAELTFEVLMSELWIATSGVQVVAHASSCGQAHNCDSTSWHVGYSGRTMMVEREVLWWETLNCVSSYCS